MVTINQANNVTVVADMTVNTFDQPNATAGSGTFTLGLGGPELLTAETGMVTISSNAVDLEGSIRTFGQNVVINGGAAGGAGDRGLALPIAVWAVDSQRGQASSVCCRVAS